ncbi:hypothetical protein CA831_38600, partial [Burkholderia multivorans]
HVASGAARAAPGAGFSTARAPSLPFVAIWTDNALTCALPGAPPSASMNRPDPDQLLDKLQRDEEKQRRGR